MIHDARLLTSAINFQHALHATLLKSASYFQHDFDATLLISSSNFQHLLSWCCDLWRKMTEVFPEWKRGSWIDGLICLKLLDPLETPCARSILNHLESCHIFLMQICKIPSVTITTQPQSHLYSWSHRKRPSRWQPMMELEVVVWEEDTTTNSPWVVHISYHQSTSTGLKQHQLPWVCIASKNQSKSTTNDFSWHQLTWINLKSTLWQSNIVVGQPLFKIGKSSTNRPYLPYRGLVEKPIRREVWPGGRKDRGIRTLSWDTTPVTMDIYIYIIMYTYY